MEHFSEVFLDCMSGVQWDRSLKRRVLGVQQKKEDLSVHIAHKCSTRNPDAQLVKTALVQWNSFWFTLKQ